MKVSLSFKFAYVSNYTYVDVCLSYVYTVHTLNGKALRLMKMCVYSLSPHIVPSVVSDCEMFPYCICRTHYVTVRVLVH